MTPVQRGFDLKPIDGTTLRALEDFKARLDQRYRERLKAVYLFGSRARGDHRPDSDLDVAIFLDNVSDPIGEQLELIDDGYPILLSTGINIQPWVFEAASLGAPERYRASHLVETVRKDGVPV
jgi:uncharacterized protein